MSDPVVSLAPSQITAARKAKGLTLVELARKAGVGLRSLQRAEKGDHIAPATLALIARALGLQAPGTVVSRTPPRRVPKERSGPRLAMLVAAERARGAPDLPERPEDEVELSALLLECFYVSSAHYAGQKVRLRAEVRRQIPAAPEEAKVLGVPTHHAARFDVATTLIGEPVELTVMAKDGPVVRALHAALGKEARELHVRLVVAEDGLPFLFFSSARGHAWTLLVEAVERVEKGAGAAPKKRRAPRAG